MLDWRSARNPLQFEPSALGRQLTHCVRCQKHKREGKESTKVRTRRTKNSVSFYCDVSTKSVLRAMKDQLRHSVNLVSCDSGSHRVEIEPKIENFVRSELLQTAGDEASFDDLVEMVRAFLAATSHYKTDYGEDCATKFKKREKKQLGKMGVFRFVQQLPHEQRVQHLTILVSAVSYNFNLDFLQSLM